MKVCELCGKIKIDGMRYGKHAVCFRCVDKVIEFAITAGMRFDEDESASL